MILEELRAEYVDPTVRIGPKILAEIRGAVGRMTARYPAQAYAGTPTWSEGARDEVVQDVTLNRLLRRGQLDYIFANAADEIHFRNLLERQVRWELIGRRTKDSVDRILARSRKILATAPFEVLRRGGQESFKLEDSAVQPRQPTAEELRVAAALVSRVPRLPDAGTERASPVYTADNLNRCLTHIAECLPTEFSVRDLDEIFSQILTSTGPSILEEIEGEPAPLAREANPQDIAIARDIVDEYLPRLDPSQVRHLGMILAGVSFDGAAKALGISRPTEIRRRSELFSGLRDQIGDLSEKIQALVAKELMVRLFGGDGHE